ncbi:MAG: hypothetical protein HQL76_06370 [Magnetococcales bacterium]|nr:hypothetical protein [Magnetococcales bacterium]
MFIGSIEMGMRFLILVLVATQIGVFSIPAYAQESATSITVTGNGATLDEARNDAIRLALQQTMSQLVVVDRAISNNAVLRDKVMSTMNGYIDAIKERKVEKTTTGFSFTADISVSASRITNFLGITLA